MTRARPASGFRPANQRAIGTIEMAAIAPAAEAHLAMTSPAVEQPERLPTHGNTDPMLDGTMPCDAYIKGLRNCPMQAPHRRPGGGLETRSRGLLFFGVWRAGYRKDREARLPARRTSQGFAGALTCTRSFTRSHTRSFCPRCARSDCTAWWHVKQRDGIRSGERCSGQNVTFPQKEAASTSPTTPTVKGR